MKHKIKVYLVSSSPYCCTALAEMADSNFACKVNNPELTPAQRNAMKLAFIRKRKQERDRYSLVSCSARITFCLDRD